jgi:hypothetical protein
MAIRRILGMVLLVLAALALSDGSAPVAPDTLRDMRSSHGSMSSTVETAPVSSPS